MKPWLEEVFQTECYICGRKGWNYHSHRAWTGSVFYCSKGCDPADVQANVKKKVDAAIAEERERVAKENNQA